MNKTVLSILVFLVLLVGGYFAGINLGQNTDEGTSSAELTTNTVLPVQPERKAEIYGKIRSIIGNEIVVSKSDPSVDPTINMTQTEKQAYMKSLDEAERAKLKEEILNATLGDVKVLAPVGIPMIKKSAEGDRDAPMIEASLADLNTGIIVSIWLNNTETERNIADFIKISNSK